MRFSIETRGGYLYAALRGRDTAEEMREFLVAVHAACQQHNLPKILMSVRQSRAVFKPEDYGLGSYANQLVSPDCRIALVGDTQELNAAHEYIEVVARQQGMDVRAFRDEAPALHWLQDGSLPKRRYRFHRIVLAGAPDDGGVYALWDGEEVIYYGRAASIRARLLEHYEGVVDGQTQRATHYSWEVCADPATREAELLREHERLFGRRPRYNTA